MKILYYTIRNLFYYNKQRKINQQRYNEMLRARGTGTFKDKLTEAMLASVGLKVVEDDKEKIPWYIPLSRIQKIWIEQVKKHGYKVGLL